MTDQVLDILQTVEFNEEGYLVDANAWNPEIGIAIATQLGLELNDRHWIVINFAREQFAQKGEAPSLRRITKQTSVGTKEIYQLFPGGPAKVAAKIAGLGKPTGCI